MTRRICHRIRIIWHNTIFLFDYSSSVWSIVSKGTQMLVTNLWMLVVSHQGKPTKNREKAEQTIQYYFPDVVSCGQIDHRSIFPYFWIIISVSLSKGRLHEKSCCSFGFCPNEGGGLPNFFVQFSYAHFWSKQVFCLNLRRMLDIESF